MANFLASSYWNVSIRRYEKRQREIITEDGLCWPEKFIVLLGWRSVGERMDGSMYSGDIFHFNVVTLVPLYLHTQLALEGKIKVPRVSAFPSSGNGATKMKWPHISLFGEYSPSLCWFPTVKKKKKDMFILFFSVSFRFKCWFKWKQLNNCLFLWISPYPRNHKNQPFMPISFLPPSPKCILLIHGKLTWNMAHVSLHYLQGM